ncbi:von Willebrand factor D and EGF domain-containing protein, partial [Elysia marginata]
TTVPQAALLITKTNVGSSNSLGTCKIVLTNDDWNASFFVRAKGVLDQIYDGDHLVQQTATIDYFNSSHVVLSEQLDSAVLTIVDRDSAALCSSVNDPHITTFDGR